MQIISCLLNVSIALYRTDFSDLLFLASSLRVNYIDENKTGELSNILDHRLTDSFNPFDLSLVNEIVPTPYTNRSD